VGRINALLKNFYLAKVIIANSQRVARLSCINSISAKVKGSLKHLEAASWGKEFWHFLHGYILVWGAAFCRVDSEWLQN
jgi:hypothetical protein